MVMKKDEVLKTGEKIENLVMVSPELKSFKSKVGGLGDVAEELSQEVANLGIKTTLVSLLYKRARYDVKQNNTTVKCIQNIDYSDIPIEDTGKTIKIEVADERLKAQIKTSKIGKATVLFIYNEIYADMGYSGDLLSQAIFLGRSTM